MKKRSKVFSSYNYPELTKLLQAGAVGVLPTDTLYGLVASALNSKAAARVYKLKQRTPTKPNIILIADTGQLDVFEIDKNAQEKSAAYWPGPVSVILKCPQDKFEYLHRGTNTLAFRLPAKAELQSLLKASGPLIAPSANFEGQPPAITIEEAEQYFGSDVDFYVEAGELSGKASRLIDLTTSEPRIIRD